MTHTSDAEQFKVVRGEPTAEELAAIIVVLRNQAAVEAKKQSVKPEWNAAQRTIRKQFAHGTNMWRRSALPQ